MSSSTTDTKSIGRGAAAGIAAFVLGYLIQQENPVVHDGRESRLLH